MADISITSNAVEIEVVHTNGIQVGIESIEYDVELTAEPLVVNIEEHEETIVEVKTGDIIRYDAPVYEGSYLVIPSSDTQVLSTKDKTLLENVVVGPIPNNYGRIVWNGSTLSVI